MHKKNRMIRQVIYSCSIKKNIQPGNAQTRQDGQTGHSHSINKRSHTAWKCTSKARWSDRSFMLNQQMYSLEMHKQGKMVRQVIHAQSTKGHIHARNAQTRQDGQAGHLCPINKRSHTIWKCTNEARWSDRSFMLNQQKATYSLEMHKQGEMVRQVLMLN